MNWRRFRNRIKEAIFQPQKTYNYVKKDIHVPKFNKNPEIKSLFSNTGINESEINEYLSEIRDSNHIINAHKKMANERFFLVEPPERCLSLYILIRHYQPDIVVETGVADGFSSVYNLTALSKNDNGNLYSIDLPHSTRDDNRKMGWIIPSNLRSRWDLRLGDSKDVLPQLLEKITPNIFFHDSLHTYDHMMFEFKHSYKYMDEGIISSHDIQLNSSFVDFAEEISRDYYSTRKFTPGEGSKNSPFGYIKL
jgi:hypothetical protein